ncbi:MAG: SpoIIE family protein phosphatase, partial [Bdellovibrionota bacterium]
TAIIAVLAARGLTSALGHLSSATQKIAEGDFGVRVDVKSGGEIGSLATSFNTMAEEVSRLMKETAQKARMESELATAKAVQETLFPEPHAQMGSVHVSGYYMPASECGGDWWHYSENGDKVYIWIADATGHGAPAALLTSATRAVVSVISHGPARPVSEALGILNRAICESSKGKMMMTFFLACIDKNTGEMTYANASHEPPLILHKTEDEPGRDDFTPLNDVNNPRLGEQIDCIFKEGRVQLQTEDRIVFYTDGVIDVKNPEQKQFGERRFLKSLATELHASPEAKEALGQVVDKLESFRSDTPLDDDVTLVFCNYKGAA